MTDLVTTNYSFTKPTVGSDSGTWGGIINTDLDDIDSEIKTVSDVADAALPKAGGVLTGQVSLTGVDYPSTALGSISGTLTLDLSLGNFFTLTVGGDITSIALSNCPASGRMVPIFLKVTNGGAHTITWGSVFKFAAGTDPVLTVSGVDLLGFFTIDGGSSVFSVGVNKNVE